MNHSYPIDSNQLREDRDGGDQANYLHKKNGVPNLGELLESFRLDLLHYARRQWRNDDRRKMGESDLVQMTLMKAALRFHDFRGATKEELSGWLRKILKHLIISQRRRFSSHKAGAGRDVPIEVREIIDEAPSARHKLLQLERQREVRDAIERLPTDYRQIIELRDFKNLKFDEIGERLNRSPDAARKLWARAILRLGDELKSQKDPAADTA